MTKSHKVTFIPSFREISVVEGSTILEAAHEAGIYIDSQCGGRGRCGKCRIRVIEGDAGPFTKPEYEFIKGMGRQQGYRLACMTRILSDTKVFLSGENIIKSKAAEKSFLKRYGAINPAVKRYHLELSLQKDTKQAHYDIIMEALYKTYGLQNLTCDIDIIKVLSKVMHDGGNNVTVYLWMDKEIVAIFPGWDDALFGMALDIGTTTVALYLCNMDNGDIIASGSVTNPQVIFGADIMSRISYSAGHPDGTKRMQAELINAINVLIDKMMEENNISKRQIVDMTVVGNTVMHHIFLGIPTDRLGLWPFTPTIQGSIDIKARDLGLNINPSGYIHVLPIEAGFIGSDNVGVLISEEPYKKDEVSLIIDLGTNGEVVLGNKEMLFACSCATGPAFEGAHIKNGMRAMDGAIEKVSIDPVSFDVKYSVVDTAKDTEDTDGGQSDGRKPIGLCGSGILDTVAQLFNAGIIGEDGAFRNDISCERLRRNDSGEMEFLLVPANETATGNDIAFTQKDIRQVQLAKAALYTGCKILMSKLNLESINRLVIAGAFGMHINKESALAIGLFPCNDPEGIIMVGNAAGHGAYLALLDKKKREEADIVAKRVIHVELALEKGFRREFVQALSFPKRKAACLSN